MDAQLATMEISPIYEQRSEDSFGFNVDQKPSGLKLAPLPTLAHSQTVAGMAAHVDQRKDKAVQRNKESQMTAEVKVSTLLDKRGYKRVEPHLPKKITEVASS